MIRDADPADRERLRAIQDAALSAGWPELLEAGIGGALVALVAEETAVVGYVLAVPGESVAYVPELAVAPAHQGEGHGSALLSALIERLDHQQSVRLVARADRPRVHAFYERHGFTAVERLEDHYEDADGVAFRRPL